MEPYRAFITLGAGSRVKAIIGIVTIHSLLFGHLPRVKIPNIISRLVQEYLYKLSGLSLSICWHVLLNLINNTSVVMVITSVSFV